MEEKEPFIDEVFVFVDGACKGNPGPSGIGVEVFDKDGKLLDQKSEYVGDKTNNEAEYEAINQGLSLARKHTRKRVIISSDSEFVIRQVGGRYRIKEDRMEPLCLSILSKEHLFEEVEYRRCPKENVNIKRVDMYAKQAIDRALFRPFKGEN